MYDPASFFLCRVSVKTRIESKSAKLKDSMSPKKLLVSNHISPFQRINNWSFMGGMHAFQKCFGKLYLQIDLLHTKHFSRKFKQRNFFDFFGLQNNFILAIGVVLQYYLLRIH